MLIQAVVSRDPAATPKLFTETPVDMGPEGKFSSCTTDGIPWTIHHGNALAVTSRLDEESFSCCVTSPPYYWLRDYGVTDQIGQEETVAAYVDSIASVMDQVFTKLKKDGLLFLNLGDTYYSGKGKAHGEDPKSKKRRFGLRAVDKSGGLDIGVGRKSLIGIPWRVAIEMMKRKWILRSAIIWHRHKALRENVGDRPRRNYEFVFMFAKERFYYFDREPLMTDWNIDEDVWTIKPRGVGGIDTAPFPEELVERCLSIGCAPDGTVLDPFAGAGTSLRVAVKSGRGATGIELNPEFCQFIIADLSKV